MLDSPSAPVLVGRETQLAVLRDFVGRMRSGTAGTLVVRGDAGAGKTRLVGELAAEARAAGATVLLGGCVAIGDQPLRHAAFIEIVRAARRHSEPADPAMVSGLATEQVLEQVLTLVDDVAGAESAVLVVEDLHWADRGTCEILTVLVRHVVGRPVGLVLTCREEMPREHHARHFLSELARAQLVVPVAVPPLSAAETARLVEDLMGDVDAVTVAKVFERSGGNPLIVEELCAPGDAAEAAAVQGPIRDILLARFWHLSEPARDVVRAVAVAGSPVGQAHLAAVAELDEKLLAGALREALDQRVLTLHDETVAVRHVLMAEALYDDLLAVERVRLHARWGDALKGGPAPLVAHHWYEAGEHELAFDANLAAAREATAVLAYDAGSRHYRQTLSLWDRIDDPEQRAGIGRADLVLRTAESANWAGDPGAAVAIVDRALTTIEVADDPAHRSVLLERRAWYLLRQGANDAARTAYDEALAALPRSADPAIRARVLAGSVRARERASDFERALALAREAVDVAVNGHVEAEIGPSRYMLGRILMNIGDADAAIEELARSAAAAEVSLNPVLLTISLLEYADALARRSRLEEAVPAALAVAERLRARGLTDPHALLVTAGVAGLQHRLGRPTASDVLAHSILDEARSPIVLALGHLVAGTIDVERSQFATAREHLETARILAAPLLDGRVGAALATARAELALAEENLDAAVSAIEEGIGKVMHSGDDEALAHLCLLGLRVEAERDAQALGRTTERSQRRRDALIERYERALQGVLDAPPAGARRPDLAAIAAAWDAERSRLAGVDDPERWAQARQRWSDVQWPRWAVYAEMRRAEALARVDAEPTLVVEAFRAAHERAEVIGSPLYVAAVARLARRAGIPVPASATSATEPARAAVEPGVAALTKREREVLDLVGTGATNRQIASRLFISEKTASVHVSRILTKLGATNRKEAVALARRAARPHRSERP